MSTEFKHSDNSTPQTPASASACSALENRSGRTFVVEEAGRLVRQAVQQQLEEFGRSRFQKEFVLLRDVQGSPQSDLKGAKLRDYLWRNLPSSPFKRMQEIFVAPEDFVIPCFQFDRRGQLLFAVESFKTLSVKALPLSPELIPERLIVGLGLTSFSGLHRNPLERLRVKTFPSVLNGLKLVWDAAERIQDGNYRILIVRTPAEALRLQYPGAAAPAEQAVGTLLYSWEISDVSKQPGELAARRLTAANFRNPYDARRKTVHQSGVYQNEISVLEDITGRTKALQAQVGRDWKPGLEPSLREEIRLSANVQLAASLEVLERCVNKHKVRAHDLLLKTLDLKDSLGRDNPSKALACMLAALVELQKRFREMYPRGGFAKQDEMMLQRVIEEHENSIARFGNAITTGAGVLNAPLALFQDNKLSSAQVQQQAAGLLRRLNLPCESLRELRLKPFLAFGRRLQEKLGEFREALELRSAPAAKDTLIKMHLICKFQAVSADFERMKFWIAQDPNVAPEKLTAFVENLQRTFRTRQIFPERIVPDYVQPFAEVEQGLSRLIQGLERYTGNPGDKAARKDLSKRLKGFLDSFNIEALVGELP